MTLNDIRSKLTDIAMSVETFNLDYLSEELFCLADEIDRINEGVVGTIAFMSDALREFNR